MPLPLALLGLALGIGSGALSKKKKEGEKNKETAVKILAGLMDDAVRTGDVEGVKGLGAAIQKHDSGFDVSPIVKMAESQSKLLEPKRENTRMSNEISKYALSQIGGGGGGGGGGQVQQAPAMQQPLGREQQAEGGAGAGTGAGSYNVPNFPHAKQMSLYANNYGIDPAVAYGLAEQESGFDQKRAGDGGVAVGYYQLHPEAAADVGMTPEDRTNPTKNIEGGMKYLRKWVDVLRGKGINDMRMALAAYHRPADVFPNGVQGEPVRDFNQLPETAKVYVGWVQDKIAKYKPGLNVPQGAEAGAMPEEAGAAEVVGGPVGGFQTPGGGTTSLAQGKPMSYLAQVGSDTPMEPAQGQATGQMPGMVPQQQQLAPRPQLKPLAPGGMGGGAGTAPFKVSINAGPEGASVNLAPNTEMQKTLDQAHFVGSFVKALNGLKSQGIEPNDATMMGIFTNLVDQFPEGMPEGFANKLMEMTAFKPNDIQFFDNETDGWKYAQAYKNGKPVGYPKPIMKVKLNPQEQVTQKGLESRAAGYGTETGKTQAEIEQMPGKTEAEIASQTAKEAGITKRLSPDDVKKLADVQRSTGALKRGNTILEEVAMPKKDAQGNESFPYKNLPTGPLSGVKQKFAKLGINPDRVDVMREQLAEFQAHMMAILYATTGRQVSDFELLMSEARVLVNSLPPHLFIARMEGTRVDALDGVKTMYEGLKAQNYNTGTLEKTAKELEGLNFWKYLPPKLRPKQGPSSPSSIDQDAAELMKKYQ